MTGKRVLDEQSHNIPAIGISEDGLVLATGSIFQTLIVYKGEESVSLIMPEWIWALFWIPSE